MEPWAASEMRLSDSPRKREESIEAFGQIDPRFPELTLCIWSLLFKKEIKQKK